MENDFLYMLAFSKLVLKLNSQQDCTEECEEIKTFSSEDQESIVNQLLSMIDKNNAQDVGNIVSALKKINYLDPLYVDDYVSVVEMKAGFKELEDMRKTVQTIISRPDGYQKTVLEYAFWKNLTLVAVNLQDNELLTSFIQKLEQAAKSIAE